MTIILFIIILAVLIFVHELGHFLAAKVIGVRVDEFGLGFPPRIFSYKKGETLYSLNAIPFGGFVKILGENPDEESSLVENKKLSLNNRSKPAQALVLIAGVCFNWLLAWFIFTIALTSGLPMSVDTATTNELENVHTVVVGINEGSPAQEAGLAIGDQIQYLASSKNLLDQPDVEEFKNFIKTNDGLVTVGFIRGGDQKQVSLTAQLDQDLKEKLIGVGLNQVGTLNLPWYKAVPAGFTFTFNLTTDMFKALGGVAKSVFTHQSVGGQVVGPVGLVGLVGDASSLGFIYVLTFMAIISINLAIINLLPFPALDGGRLLFLLIEAVTRKNIKPKLANTINLIGFSCLILLMIVISLMDIWRLF